MLLFCGSLAIHNIATCLVDWIKKTTGYKWSLSSLRQQTLFPVQLHLT